LICIRRLVAACAIAALPALALAQPMLVAPAAPAPPSVSAPLKADGEVRYALGAGGNYASGTGATLASANVGGEGAVATPDARLRFGVKALWARSVVETTSAETTTLLVTAETQQRWRGSTWFRQKLSLFPALRSGDIAHGVFDAGLAIAMTPLCSFNFGLSQRYDSLADLKVADTAVFTGIVLKLR
jgi:hypothetical protein